MRLTARSGFMLCAAATVFAVLAQALPGAEPATDDAVAPTQKIDRAVRDLGAGEFKVREQAARYLWSVGTDAEEALAGAAKSDDPEISARARELLEKVRSGLLPDTPPEIAAMIKDYRRSGLENRRTILDRLMERGLPGLRTAASLVRKDAREMGRGSGAPFPLPDRLAIIATKAISIGELGLAEDVLRAGAATGYDRCVRDFAAFALIRGNIDKEIESAAAARDKSPVQAKTLAYLYRAKGRLKEALEAAESARDDYLVAGLLNEACDWKRLEKKLDGEPVANNAEWLGYSAAYHRLAGNTNAFLKTMGDIEEYGKTHPEEAMLVAKALAANDRVTNVVSLLLAGKDYVEAGSVLSVQGRLPELRALVKKAAGELKEDVPDLSRLFAWWEPAGGMEEDEEETAEREALANGDESAQAGNFRAAAEGYGESLKKQPLSAVLMYLHGWALSRAGEEAKGREFMDRAVLMPLADCRVRHQLWTQAETRGIKEAVERQIDLVMRTADFHSWFLDEALTRRAVGEVEERKDYSSAVLLIERARLIDLGRNSGAGMARLYHHCGTVAAYTALARGASGDAPKALELARFSVEAFPTTIDDVCVAFTKIGNQDLAAKVLDVTFDHVAKLVCDGPGESQMHNLLAWVAARCRMRLDDALKHAERAAELSPNNGAILDTLAEVHFQLKHKEKAIELMRKCMEIDPKSRYYKRQSIRFREGDPATDPKLQLNWKW